MSNTLGPHGLWHTTLPCPSLSPRVCSNLCPLSWRCYLTISSSAATFFFWTSSHLDHHRALNRVRRALLVVYFIHSSVVVQLPSPVRLFATHRLQQARIPSFTISQSLLKFMSFESMIPSNHFIPFSSCPQSFPAPLSFLMNQLFSSGGQVLELQHLSFP